MGFFRSEFTIAVLKGAGLRTELKEELIRVVWNGKMPCEMSWRREEGDVYRQMYDYKLVRLNM